MSRPLAPLIGSSDLVLVPRHKDCAESGQSEEDAMAEIRVAPQRRSKALVWVLVAVVVIAAIAAWYFLAGSGQAITGV